MNLKELFVTVGFDLDVQSMAKAVGAVETVKGAMLAMGNIAHKVAEGLAEAVLGTAEYAGAIDDMSVATGISRESLQELQHVAQLSGTTFEALKGGLQTLTHNAYEASQGSAEIAMAFGKVGVSIYGVNGKLKPAEELFGDIADRIKVMPEGLARTALQMKLLGGSGAELTGVLVQGREGIAELRKEAHSLGVVLDDKTIKAGADMSDAMDRLKAAVKGVQYAIGGPLMATITTWVDALRGWIVENRALIAQDVHEAIELTREALAALAGVLQVAWRAARPWVVVLVQVAKWLVEVATSTWALRAAMVILGGAAVVLSGILLSQLGTAITALVASTGGLGIALATLASKAFTTIGLAVLGLTGGFNALFWAQVKAALGPILLGAAFLAFLATIVLVADELYTFFTGGETVIGEFADSLWAAGGPLEDLGKTASVFWDLIKVGAAAASASGAAAWEAFKTKLSDLFTSIPGIVSGTWTNLKSQASAVIDFILGKVNGLLALAGQAGAAVRGVVEKLPGGAYLASSLAGGGASGTAQPAAAFFGGGASPAASAAASAGSTGGLVANVTGTTVTINAQTGASAEEIAGHVKAAVADSMSTSLAEAAAAVH